MAKQPRPRSVGFVVLDTKTGEVLSDLYTMLIRELDSLGTILK
jgi:hypothetical protein